MTSKFSFTLFSLSELLPFPVSLHPTVNSPFGMDLWLILLIFLFPGLFLTVLSQYLRDKCYVLCKAGRLGTWEVQCVQ